MKKKTQYMTMAVAAFVFTGVASADELFIDMTGWESYGAFGHELNSELVVPLAAGSEIINIEFVDISITPNGPSWSSEFTASVNDGTGSDNFFDFWDSSIPGSADDPDPIGPASSPFANPGLFGSGPFTVTTGSLFITVYDTFNDGGDALDTTVDSGGILITYNAVPAPGALALFAAAGLVGTRRRRA